MRVTEQSHDAELEQFLMDTMAQCTVLLLRAQRLARNLEHPAASDIEVYLLAAGRAACELDVHLFAAENVGGENLPVEPTCTSSAAVH